MQIGNVQVGSLREQKTSIGKFVCMKSISECHYE